MALDIKSPSSCAYTEVSLGEIMLRLDPGDGRVRTARRFDAWEGGGEYNVARGLRRCFGLKTAVVSALADNDIGHLIEDFILQGGVDTGFINWVEHDGIGRDVRNGINFTERGFGIRGAKGTSDRGHTAASQMRPGDVDWDHLFGQLGSQWFHTGGIFRSPFRNHGRAGHRGLPEGQETRNDCQLRFELPALFMAVRWRTVQGTGDQPGKLPGMSTS